MHDAAEEHVNRGGEEDGCEKDENGLHYEWSEGVEAVVRVAAGGIADYFDCGISLLDFVVWFVEGEGISKKEIGIR